MGERSHIGWTDDTWNPWQGCHKVSEECRYCYMYREKMRYGQDPSTIIRSRPQTFNLPLTRFKGPLVFVCSWSDFFIPDADAWRPEAWQIIRHSPHLTFQILTKRPHLIGNRLPHDWGAGFPNVWLGVSVGMSKYAHRLAELLQIPARLHFLSAEPLLERLQVNLSGIDWVIAGGESGAGNNYRPADRDHFRHLRDMCKDIGIPFYLKQLGGNIKINGVYGGRRLDLALHDDIPTFGRGEALTGLPEKLNAQNY
ncbi:hypothetical protein A2V82_10335 [candidate division KSB1 bacterium RBG_16_48_16]|nr:MAG: hypothetical protein A2V82_10335 [candidate division KSB1 bacterium RBG_16_48_16]